MRTLLMTSTVALMMAAPVSAATVLAYNPTSRTAAEAPAVEGAGVTGSDLTRGAGVAETSGNSFNSRGWTETSLSNAQAADDFLTWGFTSTTAYDLTELEIAYDRSNLGAMSIELFASVGGMASTSLFSDDDIDVNGETETINVSILSGVTDVTFFLFGWGSTNGNGTFDIEPNRVGMTDAFGIFLTGEASVSAVPLPAGLPMLAAALGLFGLIRRKA